MNTTKLVPGLKVKSALKAAGIQPNHNRTLASGLKVKSSIKAAGIQPNHNRTILALL
jgi:hypothetical protein